MHIVPYIPLLVALITGLAALVGVSWTQRTSRENATRALRVARVEKEMDEFELRHADFLVACSLDKLSPPDTASRQTNLGALLTSAELLQIATLGTPEYKTKVAEYTEYIFSRLNGDVNHLMGANELRKELASTYIASKQAAESEIERVHQSPVKGFKRFQ